MRPIFWIALGGVAVYLLSKKSAGTAPAASVPSPSTIDLTGAIALGPANITAAAPPPQSAAPGEYLVTVVSGTGTGPVQQLGSSLAGSNYSVKPLVPDVYLLTFGNDPGPAKVEAIWRAIPGVRAVQENIVYQSAGL